ncbi:MAG: SpoIIE family protein phosphatase [Bacteroidia bacterium]|nr:SpoIIE family protein phosphatase [Bacteroidia bacterium]
MAIRFTIGRRIGTGFSTLIGLTIVAFVLTLSTVYESKKKTEEVVDQVAPSVAALKEYNFLLQRSQTLISKWYYSKNVNDNGREELLKLIQTDYPAKCKDIRELSKSWKSNDELKAWKFIVRKTDELFMIYQQEIMTPLNSLESYEDVSIYFLAKDALDNSEESLKSIYAHLGKLIDSKQKTAETVRDEMFSSFNFLERFVKYLGIILVVGGIFVAFFTARSIVKPVQELKKMLLSMGLGVLPKERIDYRRDEIGEMGGALNSLIESMESTTEFAKQTGSGNFDASYKPLSDQDSLGLALVKMRDDLAENERFLEQKVVERTEEVVRQKEEIQNKNGELEILYKQVTDSIHYAKRIQEAILPPPALFQQLLPNSFVLYKPKDIVSGDFYWLDKKGDSVYFAAVDCTGHGVPGAFMSIVGSNLLKDAVNNTDLYEPAEIMDKLNEGVASTLHVGITEKQTKDGMDMTLCALDLKKLKLQFAAAFNPLYIIRDGELIQHKADKFPVGAFIGEKRKFTNNVIELKKGDMVYIFSDGYADQFGGPKGKKFMAGNFRNLLLDASKLPANEQRHKLNETIESWRGGLEQVDDILIIGIKI